MEINTIPFHGISGYIHIYQVLIDLITTSRVELHNYLDILQWRVGAISKPDSNFSFEVIRHWKGPKMTQKWDTVPNAFSMEKHLFAVPRPLLHPFLAPPRLVLIDSRYTK
jgi:hypothetical protein